MSSSSSSTPSYSTIPWDPLAEDSDFNARPTNECIKRIMTDIRELYKDPAPGICVFHDPEDVTRAHALVTGPSDTPYEGGFFYFVLKCPPNYPYAPPRVRLMTTGGGTVRFNPNLYKNGKVCLSILGTWAGPSWQPVHSIGSVLISIQSLMNSEPYRNEPGFEVERAAGDIKRYNQVIHHETLRVAVAYMLENGRSMSMPEPLIELMEATFGSLYDMYEEFAQQYVHLDGTTMRDPFGEVRGDYQYARSLERFRTLKRKLGLDDLEVDE